MRGITRGADLAACRAGDAAAVDEHDRVGRRPMRGGDGTDDAVRHVAPRGDRVARGLLDDHEPLAHAVVVAECRASVGMQRREAQLLHGVLEALSGILTPFLATMPLLRPVTYSSPATTQPGSPVRSHVVRSVRPRMPSGRLR